MDRDHEKARLQEKLARCRALAEEDTEGEIVNMIRDLEEEIMDEIRRLESQ